MMNGAVGVLGTYQSEYTKSDSTRTYVEQAQGAAVGVLKDAQLRPDDIDAIVFSLAPTFFMGVADADRWALDHVFGAGKPVMRVHTGGATGGSAVHAAHSLIKSGLHRRVMVIGADRIAETPDAQRVLNLIFDPFYERDMPLSTNTSVALHCSRYMRAHGVRQEDMARVVVRARANAIKNPHAHLKGEITVDDVMSSPMIAYPLKLYDICPRSTGSAAMILGDLDSVSSKGGSIAFITGVGAVSDTYWVGDRIVPSAVVSMNDFSLTSLAARKAFCTAGVDNPASQVDVAELYDPYSTLGFMQLEQLGFCQAGEAARLEREGAWAVDGGFVAVNSSGGTLCSNPIAISGLARAIDAARQVMGTAGAGQVKNVRRAVSTASGGIFQFQNVTVFADDHR